MEINITTGGVSVLCIKIAPSQDRFACGAVEAPLKVYDIGTGTELISFSDTNYDSVSALGWKEWGAESYVVAGYAESGYLRIISSQGENALKYAAKNSTDYGFPHAAQLHSQRINSLEIIDNKVFTISDDSTLVKFSLEKEDTHFTYTRKQEKRIRMGYQVRTWDAEKLLVFNTWQIVGDRTYVISLIHADTFKVLKKWKLFTQEVIDFAKVSDSAFVFAGSEKKLTVYDWETNKITNECETEEPPRHFCVHGAQIIHSEGQKIVVRDRKSLEKINEIGKLPHNISAMDMSKDSKIVVAGDEDGNVLVVMS